MMEVRTEFGYNQENFNSLLTMIHYDLNYRYELVDAARQMYIDTFGLSEANTYYFMLSMVPTLMQVQSIQSYESAKVWIDSLDRLGLTNFQIASFVVRYAKARTAYEIARSEYILAEQTAYYLEQISYYENEILMYESDLAGVRSSNWMLSSTRSTKIRRNCIWITGTR
ncbi:MAG: hypothetical protein MZU79_02575 [Anaerotruncus sp.]|nr:hypothetical protein [Anaerotruncus sp.]